MKTDDFTPLDRVILTIWGIVAIITFLWFAIDAGITFVYAIRADTILKGEIVRSFLQLGMAVLIAVGVYFGGYLGSVFFAGFVRGIRERLS